MTYVTEYNARTLHKVVNWVLDTIVVPDESIEAVIEVVTAIEDARYNSIGHVTVSEDAMNHMQVLALRVRKFMVNKGLAELAAVRNLTAGHIRQMKQESPKNYAETVEQSRAAQASMQDAMNMAMAINYTSLGGK